MAFPRGQLTKMTIIFYPDKNLPGVGIPFTPMYNPESYNLNHALDYDSEERMIVGNLDKKFLRIKPKSLSLKLYFDGTNASPSNLSGLGIDLADIPDFNSVVAQVEAFLTLGARVGNWSESGVVSSALDGDVGKTNDHHKPMYMMVVWGTFLMTGVLSSANVKYTMFSPEGIPLRAEMDVTILESSDVSLVEKAMKLLSPDLTKAILVKEGDTLPNLCFKEYGDASMYMQIAEVNKLKNFRKLVPGTELIFPPIK